MTARLQACAVAGEDAVPSARASRIDVFRRWRPTRGRQSLKLLACVVAIVAAPCINGARAEAQTAREVIDRYVEAIGGHEAIDRIQTIRYDRILTHIDESRVITTRVYQKRPHRYRIEYPGTGTVRIANGDRAWRCTVDTSTGQSKWEEGSPMPETDFEKLLGLFLRFEQKGYVIEYVGTVSGKGRRLHELTLDRPRAARWSLFFDVETGLFTMFEPAEGTDVTLHDFREVDGVLFPHLSEARGTSPQGAAFHHLDTVTDLVLNVSLPDALFLPPETGSASLPGCGIGS